MKLEDDEPIIPQLIIMDERQNFITQSGLLYQTPEGKTAFVPQTDSQIRHRISGRLNVTELCSPETIRQRELYSDLSSLAEVLDQFGDEKSLPPRFRVDVPPSLFPDPAIVGTVEDKMAEEYIARCDQRIKELDRLHEHIRQARQDHFSPRKHKKKPKTKPVKEKSLFEAISDWWWGIISSLLF